MSITTYNIFKKIIYKIINMIFQKFSLMIKVYFFLLKYVKKKEKGVLKLLNSKDIDFKKKKRNYRD